MRLLAAPLVFALLITGPAMAAAPLAPHQALYKIEMVSKKSSTQIVNIKGQMFFEFVPVCDAWTTKHRFNMSYAYADSPPLNVTSNFSTYETKDGKSFDYNSKRRRDGEVYEELRGEASLGEAQLGKAVYSKPDKLSFDLEPGTLFPVAHTVELLKAAEAGKKFFSATVFDGSDDEGPVTINAFIGPKITPPATEDTKGIEASLLNVPAWKVRLAFFPLNSEESTAEYEMNMLVHENGVISDMRVDYHDFSVTQTVTALQKKPEQTCQTGGQP
jgi:hypothetical protein